MQIFQLSKKNNDLENLINDETDKGETSKQSQVNDPNIKQSNELQFEILFDVTTSFCLGVVKNLNYC